MHDFETFPESNYVDVAHALFTFVIYNIGRIFLKNFRISTAGFFDVM
jgi:hypothetical protein